MILPVIYFVSIFYVSESAKILAVMPTPSFSHQIFFRPLWKELAKRGHELTLITTDPMNDSTLKNLREIDVSEVYDNVESQLVELLTLNGDQLKEMDFKFHSMANATRRELLHPDVQKLLHDKTIEFDLLMIEDVLPVMFAFKHRFDVPLIGLASHDVPLWAHKAVGNTLHAILYPHGTVSNGQDMDFLERIHAFIFTMIEKFYYEYYWVPHMNNIIQEALRENVPSVNELQDRVDMIFTNSNPIFTTKRPHTPATISLVGGLHDISAKIELPSELKSFLDNAEDAAIFFNLGVQGKLIPKELIRLCITTFSQLKYNILWIYEEDISGIILPRNVKIMKSAPQREILQHDKVKLFITSGDLQSLEESVLAGVPMITIPFFGEQYSNSKKLVAQGLGIELIHQRVTQRLLRDAILEVMHHPKYATNVQIQANIIVDKPIKALEAAVWWTEYVLRHNGAQHLKGPVLGFCQYYYLDVISTLICIIFGIVVIFRCTCRICCGSAGKRASGKDLTMNNNDYSFNVSPHMKKDN